MEKTGAEKSFVVMGRSLEAALDKASIVLHWPKERIAYEILQEAKPGKYGLPSIECKLRVVPVAPSAEEMEAHGGLSEEEAILRVDLPLSTAEIAALSSEAFLRILEDPLPLQENEQFPALLPRVDTLREIIGDIGLNTGPIDHTGDLHIHGNVRKGMTVRATGAVRVFGNVETAFVDAGGDVIIDGGLLGTVRSTRGSITCLFAQGAHIDALEGSVHVGESVMHTQIHAGSEVIIGSLLLGGSCCGELRVQAQTAGSPSGVPTAISAGRNSGLHEAMERLRKRALRHIASLTEYNRVCLELLPCEQEGTALPAQDRIRLWQATVRCARLSADLQALSGQKGHLLGMINAERGSRVCIEGCAYPEVRIVIDEAGMEMRAVTQFATFSKDYDTGELRITPLH